MSSLFATLPTELVLSIILFAAEHQPTALALSLVSSWVHKHVEPALYHTVRLPSSRALAAFISTLDSKQDGFAHRAVKRLCITALGPISNIEITLSRCTGVISLACGFSTPSYTHCVPGGPPLEETSENTSVRYLPIAAKEQYLLSLACRDGLDTAIISPVVSHLRIHLTPAVTFESITRLSGLTQLTHLAVLYNQGFPGGLDAVKAILQPLIDLGRLRVLVLQVAGVGDAHLEEIRKWNQTERELRESHRAVEASGQGLTIAALKAPRSFLSHWEDSEEFWRCAEGNGSGSVEFAIP